MSKDLIVLGEDWGAHPSSTQHLVRHLASDRKVVWANSIGLRKPRFDAADARRIVKKLASAAGFHTKMQASGVEVVAAPFPVVQPIVIPMAASSIGRAINRVFLGRTLSLAAQSAGLERPVLWLTLPSGIDAVGSVGESAVVYYCCDDFGSLVGVDHKEALEFEAELAGKADLILVSSPALAARFDPAKTHIIAHGVDYELFSSPVPKALDLPAGPIAGFYGAIAPWIDLDLVAAAARDLPHWTFVMVGPVHCDVSVIENISNICLLGPRDHGALPSYAQHWDAGIIPFRDTPQIRACNPLKLREYLAAGRPVVATPFPALEEYAHLLRVVADKDSFVAALEASVGDGATGDAARRAAVSGEGWNARAARVAQLIEGISR